MTPREKIAMRIESTKASLALYRQLGMDGSTINTLAAYIKGLEDAQSDYKEAGI